MNRVRENIMLSRGEQLDIVVDDCDVEEAKQQGNNCLIGKIWAGKRVNREAFINVFKRIWRTEKEVGFKEIQHNVWIFEFSLESDKTRVLKGRPWSFDRSLLALSEFDGGIPSSQWNFTSSPFWIQIHDMPLICMTKAIGSKIGESLGILEAVDTEGDGVEWGSVLRIRVIIDIQKPLERGRSLNIAGKAHWVNFKYENLPVFCFSCGRIAHGEAGCPKRSQTEQKKEWGVWLRAEKSNRQGMGRNLDRKAARDYQGQNTGERTMGGGNPKEKGSSGFGGNPMPPHQSHKEIPTASKPGAFTAANPAVGEESVGFLEDYFQNQGEGSQENQNGKEPNGVIVGQLAACKAREVSALIKGLKRRDMGRIKQKLGGFLAKPKRRPGKLSEDTYHGPSSWKRNGAQNPKFRNSQRAAYSGTKSNCS
jgi:hypothetical protein